MPGRVADRVAIVTGAASGIGKATAGALASEGARVVLTDVQEERGQKAASEIGSEAHFLRHDVTDEASWRSVVADTRERFGALHAVVNNAGILSTANVEEATLEQWRKVQAVNVEGVFLGCKHALPAIRESGGGSIVNVSSLAALVGTPIYAAYSASKGAVRSLTKSVAAHCAERGDPIRCNSIHPGGVATPMVIHLMEDPETASRVTGVGQPEDIANLVVYLVSDESRYVNGAEIVIDGGLFASLLIPSPDPAGDR